MKTNLRTVLVLMLLGALIGPSAFAQTAGAQRSESAFFAATYWHPPVYVTVYAYTSPTADSFSWSYQDGSPQYSYCQANSFSTYPLPVDGTIEASLAGRAEVRFKVVDGFNCPFSEVVVKCRATDITQISIRETNSTTKGMLRVTHETGYRLSGLACSIQGIGAEYITNSGEAGVERTVSP